MKTFGVAAQSLKATILLLSLSLLLTSCSNDDEKDGGGKENRLIQKPACGRSFQQKAIYGKDDRRDWYQVRDDALLEWGASTVALIAKTDISYQTDPATIRMQNYQSSENLCSDQPYLAQPTAAFCSGFFVGEDRIVTAGHCLPKKVDCQNTAFVFDYKLETWDSDPSKVPLSSVYFCKNLIVSKSAGGDFAVVQLDRPVFDRTPFEIRRAGTPALGSQLTMVGYPAGLPMKIADGGSILQARANELVADVDAFAGNSGSVVINRSTGVVEGILVAGNIDYRNRGACRIEHRCGADCDGESIYPIVNLEKYIPNLVGKTSAIARLGPVECP